MTMSLEILQSVRFMVAMEMAELQNCCNPEATLLTVAPFLWEQREYD